LSKAFQAEQTQNANLSKALRAEQVQIAILSSALQAEQAENANLSKALQAEQAAQQAEQAHASHLLERIQQLEADLAVRYHYLGVFGGIGSLAKRTRALGDRITGGGLRKLAKRLLATLTRRVMGQRALLAVGRAVLKPFPKLTTALYQVATAPDPVTMPPLASPPSVSSQGQPTAGSSAMGLDFPASARPVYRRLQAAISESSGRNQNR
jgi:hypothetical protein